MKKLLSIFLLLFSCKSYNYSTDNWQGEGFTGNKKNSQLITAHKYLIATSEALASQAGAKILKKGGTAIDVAIASQMVLNVVEPQSSGIGGGLFLLYHHHKTNKNIYFNGRETSPSKSFDKMFLNKQGEALHLHSALGGLSVGTPGALSALYLAHQKYGKLPWKQLFAPAIKLAKNGYPLTNKTIANLNKYPHLKQFADMAIYYDNQKNPKPVGTIIKNPALAKTLTTIANQGIKPFYQGEIAKKIIHKVQNSAINPGLLELDDLANYKPTTGELLCSAYRSYKICTMPPSSSGITVLQTLGILENFDLNKYQPNSTPAIHLIAEATKLAYADRNQYIHDSTSVPTSQMLDKQYLKQRASLINLEKSKQKFSYGFFNETPIKTIGVNLDKPSTTHIVVLDKHKNAVSMTSSIEYVFGSGIMAEGFFLNNQLTDFSMMPVDEKGNLVANRVLPNRRPRSSMSPVFVFDDKDRLIMATGSPNGPRIIQHVLKVLIAVLDWQLNIEQAISLPNFIALNSKLELEENTEIVNLAKELQKLGHQTEITTIPSGLQAFYIDYNSNKIYASADYRRNGVAIGK